MRKPKFAVQSRVIVAPSNDGELAEFSVRMLNAGWKKADITKVGHLYKVSAVDPHGRVHGASRNDIASLIDFLIGIGALPPRERVEVDVSDELAALLNKEEAVEDGKKRLLREYDSLTQRLLDDKYVISRAETDRHEAISAILLELRR